MKASIDENLVRLKVDTAVRLTHSHDIRFLVGIHIVFQRDLGPVEKQCLPMLDWLLIGDLQFLMCANPLLWGRNVHRCGDAGAIVLKKIHHVARSRCTRHRSAVPALVLQKK